MNQLACEQKKLRLPLLSVRGFLQAITQESVAVWAPLFGVEFGQRTGPYQMASTVLSLNRNTATQDDPRPACYLLILECHWGKGNSKAMRAW